MNGHRRPLGARTWGQILSAALAVLAVIALVSQLRATAPQVELDLLVQGAEDPGSASRDEVTCERRLPQVTRVEGRLEDPVGRVTSTEVYECPDHFDGHLVEFVGEVIGDVLEREGGAWVLVNDDAYALEVGPLPSHNVYGGANTGLSVWLPERFLDLIGATGGPEVRGTVLAFEGVIRRVDPADGGGLTLRVVDATVVAEAVEIPEPLHTAQLVASLIAGLVALGAVLAERLVARSR